MKPKDKAIKKIEITIDKLIDAMDFCPENIRYKISGCLERAREIESLIYSEEESKFKK